MSVHRLEGNADKRCRKWRIRYFVKVGVVFKGRSKVFHGTKSEAEAEEKRIKAASRAISAPKSGHMSQVSEE